MFQAIMKGEIGRKNAAQLVQVTTNPLYCSNRQLPFANKWENKLDSVEFRLQRTARQVAGERFRVGTLPHHGADRVGDR